MSAAIICVVNQKGGVGKTTTAINLASFLSEDGNKTLLIDMDPQANATSGVGIRQESVRHTIYDLLVCETPIRHVLYPTPFDHLHIIPANRDLAGAEVELVSLVSREIRLRNALEPLRDIYRYIIIDCPPSLGLLTVNALVASDHAVIPVQCEYFALEGLAGLVHTIDLIRDQFNPKLKLMGIVLTMFDKRTAINRQVEANTRSFFQHVVFDTIVPRNTRLAEAPSHGLPIALYHPASKGALAYYALSKEVMSRV